jgi:K+ transporter
MTIAIFQCLKQSIALGCFPRLKIVHTSRKFVAKIYIPVVNWFLLASCLGFIVLFRSTYDVGNAYGNNIALEIYFYANFVTSLFMQYAVMLQYSSPFHSFYAQYVYLSAYAIC